MNGFSVFRRRLLRVIDDQNLDRPFPRVDLEPHLFLQRRNQNARGIHTILLIHGGQLRGPPRASI